MNKARAMLDALMGPGRDETPKDDGKAKWKDRTVCKNYLIGFCGKDKGLLGGKRTIEVCSKIHSDVVRQQFEQAPGEEREAYRKDCELISLKDLDFLLRECEAHSNMERQRIRDDVRRKKPVLSPEVNMRLSAIKRESTRLLELAEALDDDKTKEREAMVEKSNELLQEHEDVLKEETRKAIEAQDPEEVCEVCGTAYKGKSDYDTHLNYRVHQGYTEVRKRHEELRAKKESMDTDKEEERKQKRKEEWEGAQAKERGEDGKDSKEKDDRGSRDSGKEAKEAKDAKDGGGVKEKDKDDTDKDKDKDKKESKERSRKDRSSRDRRRSRSRDRERRRADRGRSRSRSRRRR